MTEPAQTYIGDHLPLLVSRVGLSWVEVAEKVSAHLQNGPLTAEYLEALGTGLLPVPTALARALCQVLKCKRTDLELVGDPALSARRAAFETYVRSAGLDFREAANLALCGVRIERRASLLVTPAEWKALHAERAQRTFDDLLRQATAPPTSVSVPAEYRCTIPCPRCGALNEVDGDQCYACGRHLHQPDD